MMIALDPGTRCGWAYGTEPGQYGCRDLSPLKARKARPATRKRAAMPAVAAEPEYARCGKMLALLDELSVSGREEVKTVVCEGAAGFLRGKHAVRVAHELRGAVKAWCWEARTRYVQVEPGDLKRYATGSTVADKPAMIAAARKRFGYEGDSDDVADALHLLAWGRENLPKTAPAEAQATA